MRSWNSIMEQQQPPARWSSAVEAAGWIVERLASFGTTVTAVVPAGYESYARVLHPAEASPWGGHRVVRWREVAAWSGVSLGPDAQFHTVALPPRRPEAPAPWSGQGPHEGSLHLPDAEVLAEILRDFTTTPEECFFCVWDGYGWEGRRQFGSPGTTPVTLPDPVPEAVRRGRRIRLPGRDYLLYNGPVEAITAPVDIGHGQTCTASRSPCGTAIGPRRRRYVCAAGGSTIGTPSWGGAGEGFQTGHPVRGMSNPVLRYGPGVGPWIRGGLPGAG
jgi:hypothetical protein